MRKGIRARWLGTAAFVGIYRFAIRNKRLAGDPIGWFPTPCGRMFHAQLRRTRILLTHVSIASRSFLSSAGPGTGARAAGPLSWPGSQVEHLVIAVLTVWQS